MSALGVLVAVLVAAAALVLVASARRISRPPAAAPTPAAPTLGALVVDEVVVPIRRITLERGAFVLHCHLVGPAPAVDSTHYTVHDQAGGLVYRSSGAQVVRWPRLGRLDSLTVSVYVESIGKVSQRIY